MKRAFLSLSILLLANLSASAFVDLGNSAGYTPYDSYIRPVKQVLGTLDGPTATLERVKALMTQGRCFRYSHTDPYTAASPAVTAARRVGDCKDKALWLCDQLGDKNVRFVIGKMKRSEHVRHAWVMWNDGSQWWVLDCTLNYQPIPADRVASGDYVPLYSWAKDGSYRHGATQMLTADASRTGAPVASKIARR